MGVVEKRCFANVPCAEREAGGVEGGEAGGRESRIVRRSDVWLWCWPLLVGQM
jgi:hypothetical protein